MLWHRKELVGIYLFEECFCDVFLNANLITQEGGSWTNYLLGAPYCLLLLIGLAMSHWSRKRQIRSTPKNHSLRAILRKSQAWQQRYPIFTALLSITLILCGEMVEQELLENLSLFLLSPNHSLLFLIAFPFLNMVEVLSNCWIILPLVLPLVAFWAILRILHNSLVVQIVIKQFKLFFVSAIWEKSIANPRPVKPVLSLRLS